MFISKLSKVAYRRYLTIARTALTSKQLLSASIIAGLYCNHSCCDDKYLHPPEKCTPVVTRPPIQNIQSRRSNKKNIRRAIQWFLRKLETFFRLISRSIYLTLTFGPAILTSPLLLSDNDDIKGRWWAFFRDRIRKSGPCCTKFAQWIATRPDLFPLLLCKNLEDLQSKALSHSWRDTEDALFLAFGDDWKKSLHIEGEVRGSDSFSPVVLGSGCVAQVLLGRLGDRQVAVKIIHPGA